MENETPGLDRPDTSNFLKWVEIKNFKSIKDLRLDCKRVNIFIGKPNVGKSNILEGLGLLGPIFGYKQSYYFKEIIRYEDLSDLFIDNNTRLPVIVKSDINASVFRRFPVDNQPYALISGKTEWIETNMEAILESVSHLHQDNGWINSIQTGKYDLFYPIYLPLRGNGENDGSHTPFHKAFYDGFDGISMIKKYEFKCVDNFHDIGINYLLPPNGDNMFDIVDQNYELRKEIGRLFENDNLEFVLSKKDKKFYLQRKEDDYVYLYPFFSIADTFRRFMFYITAIESNKNSVIVFEEPEVHSFPPYTQEMAYRMIYDESNQYFISTHSPYMLHPFIEKMDYKDLNIFITYYQDYKTHVRALTEEEFRDILDYSTNIFFNLRKFEPNA